MELGVRHEVIGYVVFYNTHWDKGQRRAIMPVISGRIDRRLYD